jgi:hypothetical protein
MAVQPADEECFCSCGRGRRSIHENDHYSRLIIVCETYIGKPFGTRVVPTHCDDAHAMLISFIGAVCYVYV